MTVGIVEQELVAFDAAKVEALDLARVISGVLRDPDPSPRAVLDVIDEAIQALTALREAALPLDERERARHRARLVKLYVETGDDDALEYLLGAELAA